MKIIFITLLFFICCGVCNNTNLFWPPDIVPHPIPPENPDPREPQKDDPTKDIV